MKTRNGYVSNSSSSSFVVRIRNCASSTLNLDDGRIATLLEMGFKWCSGSSRSILFDGIEQRHCIDDFRTFEDVNLALDVICNDEEVSEVLFREHIPFVASIHYDEWLWVYDGGECYDVWANYPQMVLHFSDYNPASILRFTKPYSRKYIDSRVSPSCKRKVFICSPYRGDVEHNVEMAKGYCRKAVKDGCIPIAPHLYFPHFLDDSNEIERCNGIEFGVELLKLCDEVWVFADNKALTEGMKREVDAARDEFKFVRYFSSDGNEEYLPEGLNRKSIQ